MYFTTILRRMRRWAGLLFLAIAFAALLALASPASAQQNASLSVNADVTDEWVIVHVQSSDPLALGPVHVRYRESNPVGPWIRLGSSNFRRGVASFRISTGDLQRSTEYRVEARLQRTLFVELVAFDNFTLPSVSSVTALSVSSISRTSALATVTISDATEGSTVHLQHRIGGADWGESDVHNLTVQEGGIASHTLEGLSPETSYDVRASFDSTFPDDQTETAQFATASLAALVGISVDEVTDTTATVTVSVNHFEANLDTIHLRYREGGTPSEWLDGPEPDGGVFQLSGLQPNTAYTVQASLDSDFATDDEAEFTTSPAKPDPPANIRITDEADSSLAVAWDPPLYDGGSDITGYRVQWKAGDEEFVASRQAEVSGTSYTIASLTNGIPYNVRLMAVNGAGGVSRPSGEISGTPSTTPNAPVILETAAAGVSITISWSAPDNGGSAITGYEVQWKSGDEEFTSARQMDASDTTSTIGGLSAGTAYQVRVRAINTNGAGGWSDESAISTGVPPGQPTNVELGFEFGQGILRLEWDAPSESGDSAVRGYEVQLAQNSNFSNPEEGSLGGSSRHYEFPNLTPGVDYYARVRAVNESGPGPWSAVVSRPAPSRPAAPVITSVVPGDEELTITWEGPEHIDGDWHFYRVEFRNSEDPPFPGYEETKANEYPTSQDTSMGATSHTITGLINGTRYWVRVYAVSSVDWGDISEVVTGTPVASELGAPTITGSTATTDSLTINWAPPSRGPAVTSYEVRWNQSMSGFVSAISGTSYIITGLNEDRAYNVRVRAVSGDILSAWSTTSAISTHAGIPDQPVNLGLYRAGERFSVGHGQLYVRWQPPDAQRASTWRNRPLQPSSITGYRVEYSLNDDFDDSTNVSVDGSRRDLLIGGLTPRITYYVRVAASTVSGEGSPSAALSAQPLSRAGAPTITGIELGDGYLIVHWDPPADDGGSDIRGYDLQYRTIDDPPFPTNSENTGIDYQNTVNIGFARTTGQIDGLTNGVDYELRVFAETTAVCCGYVSQAAIGTPTASTLTAPTITGSTATTNSITVTWTAPSEGPQVTSYHLQWRREGSKSFFVNPDFEGTGITKTSFTITRLEQDTKYDIRVRALSNDINGAWSALFTAITQPGIPTQPDDVELHTAGHGELRVSWEPPYDAYIYDNDERTTDIRPSSITDYRVEWSLNADFSASTSISVDGSRRDLLITGLTPLTTYYVRVAASTVNGEGPPSAALSAQPLSRPGTPANISVTPGDGQLTVTWAAPSNGTTVTGYRVQWKSGAEEFVADPRQATTAETSYTITGLSNGIAYEVRVFAYNDIGDSDASQPASGTPGPQQN